MMMGMSVEADTYDDTYDNTYIVLAAKSGGIRYAVTGNFVSGSTGQLQKQEVILNSDNKIVYLVSESELNQILWHTWKSDKGNIILKNEGTGERLNISDAPSLTYSTANYFSFNSKYSTFTYTKSSTLYGITLFGTHFSMQNESTFKNTTLLAKPYFLAEHTWRTLGSSFFGTICFPKAVRAAERAGATFDR